jgi:hypothetical protein
MTKIDLINLADPLEPKPGDTIAVWFSCGAASAVALKTTIDKYPECKIKALNNYIEEEDNDNRRFLHDVEEWLDIEIEDVRNPLWPEGSIRKVWEHRRFMSGVAGAPCTRELKFNARLKWEKENKADWTVLGFTYGEERRHSRFKEKVPTLLPVLIDAKKTKGDCFREIMEAGIELPVAYIDGYPNANCRGCVKVSSPTYWNHVRKKDPDVFKERAEMSRRLGAKLAIVKGVRTFLDELDPEAKGHPLKDLNVECGIFCPHDD